MIASTMAWRVLGTFSKGLDGSVSINFGLSGGKNCDDGCQHKGNGCYAERVEGRHDRRQLAAKLERHEQLPAWKICGAALLELQAMVADGDIPPWVRFSTNGSVPMPDEVQADKLFRSQLRTLVKFCVDNGIPVHLPVESGAKAQFYRGLIGDLVTVRESLQTESGYLSASGAVSWVAGKYVEGDRIRERRLSIAEHEAKLRRLATGRPTIVCPAVKSSFRKTDPIKCGQCKACSMSTVDVVYPFH